MAAVITYIALGSNLNFPVVQVNAAIQALQRLPNSHLLAHSSLYKTAPVGYLQQPDFINAVAKLSTALSPHLLLEQLQTLERQHGRERSNQRNAPRILDLDIVLYGNLILNDVDLSVPHPRLYERAFVLYPLAEIAPNLILPNGKSVQELLNACSLQGVEKLA